LVSRNLNIDKLEQQTENAHVNFYTALAHTLSAVDIASIAQRLYLLIVCPDTCASSTCVYAHRTGRIGVVDTASPKAVAQ
jgi:hypothetical protein